MGTLLGFEESILLRQAGEIPLSFLANDRGEDVGNSERLRIYSAQYFMKGAKKMGTQSLLEAVGNGRIERVVIGKMRAGVDLIESLKELAKQEGISAGVILSGVGALEKAVFRNLKVMPGTGVVEDHHRLYLRLEQPMELVSMTGWIAAKEDGEPEIHAHFSASTVMGEEVATLGGHLSAGVITSIKVVVIIGVIAETTLRARVDPRIHQTDVVL
jgi:predicted DNA-binding protein with PD1-like motif